MNHKLNSKPQFPYEAPYGYAHNFERRFMENINNHQPKRKSLWPYKVAVSLCSALLIAGFFYFSTPYQNNNNLQLSQVSDEAIIAYLVSNAHVDQLVAAQADIPIAEIHSNLNLDEIDNLDIEIEEYINM